MSDAGMFSFDADGEWHIMHGTPGAGLVPTRLDGGVPVLEEVSFLADCVSFDHDMPTVVRPSAGTRAAHRPVLQPLFDVRSKQDTTLAYYDSVSGALGEASGLRLGDVSLPLRYGERSSLLPFRRRFAGVQEPLALYAMATRQVEILGEYLSLYRVLEWARKDNGIAYIEQHLSALSSHSFGEL